MTAFVLREDAVSEDDRVTEQKGLTRHQKIRLTGEALLAGIPYIGGVIQTSVFGRLNELRTQRLEEFVAELSQRLEVLGENPEFVEQLQASLATDERFMLFVYSCFERVYREYEHEKFQAYKEAFIRGLTDASLSIDMKLAFIQMLDRMGPVDLHVLGHLSTIPPDSYMEAARITEAVSDHSEEQRLFVLSATDTLANLQLIEVGRIGLDDESFLHREKHDYRLTELGRSLVDFIGGLGQEPEASN